MVSRLALDSNLYGAYTIPSTTIVGSPLRASTTLDRTALVSPTVGTTGGYYRLLRDSALPTIVADPQHVSTILDQQAELRRIQAEKDRLASEHAFIRASTTGVHEENQKLRQVVAEQAGAVNSAQYEVLAHQAQSQKAEQEKRVVVDVNQSLQQRIAALEQENQRLRGSVVELQARSVDWENLRRSNEVLSADNANLRKRVDELSVHIADADALRNKIVLITQENERVARLYQDRIGEIDGLRRQVVELQGRLVDWENLRRSNEVLSADNANLRKRVDELSVHIADAEALRNKIVLITQENERVARLYQDRIGEIDGLRRQVVELQGRLVDWENLRRSNEVLSADNANLRKRVDELSVHIADADALRNKIVLITQENERVARLYQDRVGEIDGLRRQVVELQGRLVDWENLRRSNEVLSADNANLRKRVDELSVHITDAEALRNKIVLITQENERVARLYQDRLAEIDSLRKNAVDSEGLRN